MKLGARTRIGPAGYPAQARGNARRVFAVLKEAGLSALEYAAVYGLRVSEKRARLIGMLAEESDITMSVHAPYYISLASRSRETRARSVRRLVHALTMAPLMGVRRIVFHAGGYSGLSHEEAYRVIRDALAAVWAQAGHLGGGALLAPETSGKLGSFGSPEELMRLCSELEGVIPTIDWAHLYARGQGRPATRAEYEEVLTSFEDALGELFVKNMHFHVSGILYTEAGEKQHMPLGMEWGPDILPLVELVDELGYTPTFISETPDSLRGALYVKFLFEGIRGRTDD